MMLSSENLSLTKMLWKKDKLSSSFSNTLVVSDKTLSDPSKCTNSFNCWGDKVWRKCEFGLMTFYINRTDSLNVWIKLGKTKHSFSSSDKIEIALSNQIISSFAGNFKHLLWAGGTKFLLFINFRRKDIPAGTRKRKRKKKEECLVTGILPLKILTMYRTMTVWSVGLG